MLSRDRTERYITSEKYGAGQNLVQIIITVIVTKEGCSIQQKMPY